MWRLTTGQQLVHRAWDKEYVVFNDVSGDTHLVGELAFAVLQELAAGPAGPAALRDRMRARLHLSEQEMAEIDLDELVNSLRQLHLVEPV
jgi:PqqD family protein of HPr-rel-A system